LTNKPSRCRQSAIKIFRQSSHAKITLYRVVKERKISEYYTTIIEELTQEQVATELMNDEHFIVLD
jgi:nitrogen regulatory protein PII-like uncharacterized protein